MNARGFEPGDSVWYGESLCRVVRVVSRQDGLVQIRDASSNLWIVQTESLVLESSRTKPVAEWGL
jgi:hypothetical protein